MASSVLHLLAFAFFPTVMALSASMDLLTFTIPNRLCIILAVGYLILAAMLGIPAVDILLNVSCALAILVITFAMFNFGWIGGGDAKLAAATAAWLGWTAIFDYGLAAALFGGGLTFDSSGRAYVSSARRSWPYGLACAIAQRQRWGPLWNCVGGGGVDAISEFIDLGCSHLSQPCGRRRPRVSARKSPLRDLCWLVPMGSPTVNIRFRSFSRQRDNIRLDEVTRVDLRIHRTTRKV